MRLYSLRSFSPSLHPFISSTHFCSITISSSFLHVHFLILFSSYTCSTFSNSSSSSGLGPCDFDSPSRFRKPSGPFNQSMNQSRVPPLHSTHIPPHLQSPHQQQQHSSQQQQSQHSSQQHSSCQQFGSSHSSSSSTGPQYHVNTHPYGDARPPSKCKNGAMSLT